MISILTEKQRLVVTIYLKRIGTISNKFAWDNNEISQIQDLKKDVLSQAILFKGRPKALKVEAP